MYKSNKNIKLSISILVSDSIDTIRKCMESLAPILEKVPSELIVVDTGGTDGSIEIAREYATEVVKFAWCRDFAKARNAGLEKACGEWFLFLDDDEWFEDVTEIVDFFNSGEYKKYRCASYCIRNYSNIQGSAWHDVRSYRMVRMEKNTKFLCPVHEMLQPIYYPEKVLECYLHHYGYVYKDDAEMRKHGLRNISLIKEVLEKEPENYRLWLQLVQEYRSINEVQLSEEVGLTLLQKIPSIEALDGSEQKMLGWILHNIVGMEMIKQDYESAYEYGVKFLKYKWINHITKAVLSYRLICLAYELKKYKEIPSFIDIYEKNYQTLNGSLQLRREEIVLDMEELITEKQLSEVYVIGIRAADKTGEKNKKGSYIRRLVTLEPCLRTAKELEELLGCLLEEKWTVKNTLLTYLYKNEENKNQIESLTESEKWSEEEKKELFQLMASLNLDSKDTLPFRLINAFGSDEFCKKDLEEYLAKKEKLLDVNYELWKIIDILEIDISKYIEKYENAVWVEQVNTCVLYGKEEKIKLLQNVLRHVEKKNFKTEMLRMRCIEKEMKAESIKEATAEQVRILGENYKEAVLYVFSYLYNREAFFNEYFSLLPKEVRFVVQFDRFITKDLLQNEKVELIRKLTKVYPEMAEFCKRLALEMKEKAKKQTAESKEFYQLAQAVKEKIFVFLEQKNMAAANQIFMQLKQLVPEDEELEKIEQQIKSVT